MESLICDLKDYFGYYSKKKVGEELTARKVWQYLKVVAMEWWEVMGWAGYGLKVKQTQFAYWYICVAEVQWMRLGSESKEDVQNLEDQLSH